VSAADLILPKKKITINNITFERKEKMIKSTLLFLMGFEKGFLIGSHCHCHTMFHIFFF
jgi:hypothetical protein